MSLRRAMAKQVLLGGLTQILVSARGLVIMPIIVKASGESVFGAYILLSSLVIFTLGISSFGTNYAYRRELPSTTTAMQRRELLMPTVVFRLISTSLLSTVIYFGAVPLFSLFGEEASFSPEILVLWLAGLTVHEIVTDYFRYTSRFGIFNLLLLGQIYLHIAATVGAVLVYPALSLDTLLALQAISFIIVSVPTLTLGVLRETGVSWPRTNLKKFVDDAKLGLALNGEFVVDFLASYGDRYLIGVFLTVSAVGQYQAAYALAGLLVFFPKVISIVITPTLCKLWDAADQKEAQRIGSQAINGYIVLAIPFVIGTALVGPSVLSVLTTPQVAVAGRWAIIMIAVAMLFYGFVILISNASFVTKKTRVIVEANVVAIVGNLSLNAAVLPVYPHITAPAAIAVVSYATAFVYAWRRMGSHFHFSFQFLTIVRALCASAVMGACLWLMGFSLGEIEAGTLSYLVLAIMMSVVTYFISFLAIGGLSETERYLFTSFILRKKKRVLNKHK